MLLGRTWAGLSTRSLKIKAMKHVILSMHQIKVIHKIKDWATWENSTINNLKFIPSVIKWGSVPSTRYYQGACSFIIFLWYAELWFFNFLVSRKEFYGFKSSTDLRYVWERKYFFICLKNEFYIYQKKQTKNTRQVTKSH